MKSYHRRMQEKDVLQYKRSIDGNIIYEGWASPLAKNNAKAWMLRRTIFDGNGVTESAFAQSKVNFSLTWGAREMYVYDVA